MVTLYHQVWINAPTTKLYEAISTEKGVGSWWDKPQAIESERGPVWEFRPGAEHGVLSMKVLEQVEGKWVEWECISTHPGSSPASAWTGIHVSFEITERETGRSWIFAIPAGMRTVNISDSATIIGPWRCKSLSNGVNHNHSAVNNEQGFQPGRMG